MVLRDLMTIPRLVLRLSQRQNIQNCGHYNTKSIEKNKLQVLAYVLGLCTDARHNKILMCDWLLFYLSLVAS